MKNNFEPIWRPIPMFSSYEASNNGKIRDIFTGNILKPISVHDGEPSNVAVYKDIKYKDTNMRTPNSRLMVISIGDLVFLAFTGLLVNTMYKDGNPHNTNLSNLYYVADAESETRLRDGRKILLYNTYKV